MAFRVANATGNFGTAATWDQGTNTPTLHASTNTTLGTVAVSTATFTAPNTSNKATGVLVYLVNKGTASTITATLVESGVNKNAATITLSNIIMGTSGAWIYFRITPYTFTTTGAGAYRWDIKVDAGTTTTVAQATTANPAYISTDDRHTVPVDGDAVYIIGTNNATAVDVTLDSTRACGAGTGSGTSRSITNGLQIGNAGMLVADTSASCQITCRGGVFIDVAGEYRAGTTGSPYPAAKNAIFIVQPSSDGAQSFAVADGGKLTLQGAAKSSTTLWKTTYVSGTGTAASPLVVADSVDWSVGDEILVGASSNNGTNYGETESRFIITKNSATSYVVSSTSGGSETALTYTHTDALITNVQRNVVIKGSSTILGIHYAFAAQTNTGNIDIDWARFENIAQNNFLGASIAYIPLTTNISCDYSVAYYGGRDLWRLFTINQAQTYTGLIAYSTATTSATIDTGGFYLVGCKLVSMVDCVSMANGGQGFLIQNSYANNFTRCISIGSATSAVAGTAGMVISGSGQNVFTDCEFHANNLAGVYLSNSANDTFVNSLFGTKGKNQTVDITGATGGLNNNLFDSCTFDSTTMISNYLNQTLGSETAFNRINDTDNNHAWYTTLGHGTSEDTVIRSPGLSVKLVPEDLATGFTWQFQIPVVQNSICSFRGYFLKNATLGSGVVTINLYLPDNPVTSGVPDTSFTLDNTTGSTFSDANEQPVFMSANYTGDIPGVATVQVNVKSNTGGAALYADDFFNAGDRTTTFDQITGLNTWVNGKPISVIQPSVPSADDTAAAVWNYLKSNAGSSGTMGESAIDAADNAELAAIK